MQTIETDPRAVGVLRAAWTAPALAEYLARQTSIQVSDDRVQYYLHQHGYVVRRPTWAVRYLRRRDPQYQAKRLAPRRS